ncbi:trypsin-like peptidase domain-containing protein [Streptomyces sp. Ru72]|uniref:trypsin-like peptidase domain-containing protein n=1 Tax=Streptomyces sp. Ru72 TaxID=2080747 RepID=UPI000CDD0529|nr:trypsin-like peptidase domain-containing protein [Streptomyces sp. Ru72]POX45174.1 protease [Streptomyces sp. Ru72]
MNEGKPVPAAGPEDGASESGAARDAEGATNGGRAPGGESGGDFELPAPAGARPRGEAGAEGDFELERPAAARTGDAADGLAKPVTADGDGDFELERPAAAGTAPKGSAGHIDPRQSGDAPDALDGRVEALHDPDPYNTPPYGEPGPWAPAPPVQHPAAPSPPDAAPQSTPPPPGAPVPGGAGVPEAPVPGATAVPTPPTAPLPGGPTGPSGAPSSPSPWQNYDPWAPRAPFQQNGATLPGTDQRRGSGRKALVVVGVLVALLSGGIGGVVGAAWERDGGIGEVRLPQAGKEPAGRAPDSVAGIAARALPSVVTLHVKGASEEGTGTGFVLDGRGHILTNNHVVQPAAAGGEITVTFNGGQSAKATVVGRDTGYDLAVVKVTGVRGLAPLPLGNSDNVEVGDPVVAIGAPFDLAGTVTSGIISAKERPITAGGEKGDGSDVSYVDALQTDAPINPGNSGGPLLDGRGRVVGINSAIRSAGSGSDQSGQAGSIGLGFAIPVNQAKRVAEELINTGRATHPVIGVTLDMNYTGDGARVGAKGAGGGPAVTRGGAGDKAGIKPGDVITEVDGVRVHSGEELIIRTRAHRPGDRLQLTVVRGGAERRITLVLGSADGS